MYTSHSNSPSGKIGTSFESLLDSDGEWYNIPPIVRNILRQVSTDLANHRSQIRELQSRNIEARESVVEWSEYATRVEKECIARVMQSESTVSKLKHEVGVAHAQGQLRSEGLEQQISAVRDDVASIKQKNVSLQTELYKCVDDAAQRSLVDTKARWEAMETGLYRAVEATKASFDDKACAASRGAAAELNTLQEKLRLLAEETSSSKLALQSALSATRQTLTDEMIVLSNRVSTLDRLADDSGKEISRLVRDRSQLDKLLEDNFQALPRRFAQFEEGSKFTFRDIEVRLQNLKDDHQCKLALLQRDVEESVMQQNKSLEALRVDLTENIEDVRECSEKFVTHQGYENASIISKVDYVERFIGATHRHAAMDSQNVSEVAPTSPLNTPSRFVAGSNLHAKSQQLNRSTQSAVATNVNVTSLHNYSANHNTAMSQHPAAPLEEIIASIATALLDRGTSALEAKLSKVQLTLDQGLSDARSDCDAAAKASTASCFSALYESVASVRSEIETAHQRVSSEVTAMQTRLEQLDSASMSTRMDKLDADCKQFIATGTASARLVTESLSKHVTRDDQVAMLQQIMQEVHQKTRETKVELSEMILRARTDLDNVAAASAEKQSRLRSELVALHEEHAAAQVEAILAVKTSSQRFSEDMIAEGVRRAVQVSQDYTSEKLRGIRDSVEEHVAAATEGLETNMHQRNRDSEASQRVQVEESLAALRHEVKKLTTRIDTTNAMVVEKEETIARLVRAANAVPEAVQASVATACSDALSSLRLDVAAMHADVVNVTQTVKTIKSTAAAVNATGVVVQSFPPHDAVQNSAMFSPPPSDHRVSAWNPNANIMNITPISAIKNNNNNATSFEAAQPLNFDAVSPPRSHLPQVIAGGVLLDFSSVDGSQPVAQQQHQGRSPSGGKPSVSAERPRASHHATEAPSAFAEQAMRLRTDVNDILSRLHAMDGLLRDIETIFSDKFVDAASTTYTKSDIDERFETHWHSVVTLLARKEDTANVDVKIRGVVTQCMEDARAALRDEMSKYRGV